MDADQLLELNRKVDKLKRAKERAAGNLQALKDQLKKEFGVESIKEAQKLLTKLTTETEKIREQLESQDNQFGEEYHARIRISET